MVVLLTRHHRRGVIIVAGIATAQKIQNLSEMTQLCVSGLKLKNEVLKTAETKVAGRNTRVRNEIAFMAALSACAMRPMLTETLESCCATVLKES